MEEILKQILNKIEILGERIDAHDRGDKEDFKRLDRKLENITEVVAKTMEDITELKEKADKQEVEIRVIKSAR